MTEALVPMRTLIQRAERGGLLSPESAEILQRPEAQAEIQAALDASWRVDQGSEVLLVTILVDDSMSIATANKIDAIMYGHNQITLDALRETPKQDTIMLQTRLLNGGLLNPYCPITEAEYLTHANYSISNLGTPLFDQATILLGTTLAKYHEILGAGVPLVRSGTLIITDGEDNRSREYRSADVCHVVTDMEDSGAHIVVGMGIDNGHTDYRRVFREMGIQDDRIVVEGDEEGVRRAFGMFVERLLALTAGSDTGPIEM